MPADSLDAVLRHHTAEIQPGLRLHSVIAGAGDRIVVLLHGFPQTWWERCQASAASGGPHRHHSIWSMRLGHNWKLPKSSWGQSNRYKPFVFMADRVND